MLIIYTYDKNGNRLTMTDSLTGTTNYAYDILNRVTSITNPSNETVNFTYDELSRRSQMDFSNNVTSNFKYDKVNQLINLDHNSRISLLSSFNYEYDKVGNRNKMNVVRSLINVTPSLSYLYDNLYRLKFATNPLPGKPDETFIYDSLGNRIRRDGEILDSVFDLSNRLLENEQFIYTYDENGNLLSKKQKDLTKIVNYTYDAENQLIRIDSSDNLFSEYRYDGLGRRIEKIVNDVITRYIYDDENVLFEFDGSNKLLAKYTHGLGMDEPLMMERDLNSNQIFELEETFYYHSDNLGTITDLTNSEGNIIQSYVYDSFGQIIQQSSGLSNPYTYTGRELDLDSGLYFYRARFYDPSIGRFLQEDPIGQKGATNPYAYVNNNPINKVDPSGNQAMAPPIGPICTTLLLPSLSALPPGWVICSVIGTVVVGDIVYQKVQARSVDQPFTCKRTGVFKKPHGVVCRYRCGPWVIDRFNKSPEDCPETIPPGEMVPGEPIIPPEPPRGCPLK